MENICQWNKCRNVGKYRAPTERDNIKNFKWLCEKHIVLFNKNWNYFEGMSENEIQKFIKSDLTWHRPTQKFGAADNFFNILWNNALNDKFNFFNENNSINKKINGLSEKDKDTLFDMIQDKIVDEREE